MKTAYLKTLTELMRKDKKLITITADMGFSVYEEMQKEFPERFINTGVTEQGSMSFAAGMALADYKVFIYAQGIFITMRCLEQVRLDVAYNHLNVKIIGVNCGFSLNQLGVSHFALEDVALMRMLPGMTIFTPGDPMEMKWAVKKAYEIDGPTYLRFTKMGNTVIHTNKTKFVMGEPVKLTQGKDATFFVSGGILEIAKEVILQLKKQNINIALYSVPTIKPLNEKIYIEIMKQSKYVFTLEEHSIIGGLGSAVAELISENNLQTSLVRLGTPDKFTSITGSMEYLLKYNQLSSVQIAQTIKKQLKKL